MFTLRQRWVIIESTQLSFLILYCRTLSSPDFIDTILGTFDGTCDVAFINTILDAVFSKIFMLLVSGSVPFFVFFLGEKIDYLGSCWYVVYDLENMWKVCCAFVWRQEAYGSWVFYMADRGCLCRIVMGWWNGGKMDNKISGVGLFLIICLFGCHWLDLTFF
jgi:hypothetical protein